jgi:hypothetical protein
MQTDPIIASRSRCCVRHGVILAFFASLIALAAIPQPEHERLAGAAQAKNEPAPVVNPQEAAQIRLPDKSFFAEVKDKRPVASIAENYWEYLAFAYVFNHVKNVSPEALARHSKRDVGYADLINDDRANYLRQLVRVEGKLIRLTQRSAADLLNDPEKHIYEGWLLHENEPQHPVCIAFTELPVGLEVGERLNVSVAFDGYYFKLLGYRSGERDKNGREIWRTGPLLIGRTLTVKEKPQPEPPVIDPDALAEQQVRLPKEIGPLKLAIADTAKLPDPKKNPREWEALTRIIAHASQVPLSALKLRHRPNISYQSLMGDDRGSFYRDLLLIRGRLFDLRQVELGDAHKAANLKQLYQGWMYHDGDVKSPVRVVLTELPEGFVLGESINEPIEFDAYYFKLATFAGEEMAGQPAPRYAPVMIGRSFRVINTEPAPADPARGEAEQVSLSDWDFSQVRDKRPIASYSDNLDEYLAYNHVFAKVMQFSPEVLARNSRKDVVYADLINEVRETEYLRKLIHVKGRLVRVRQREAKDFLRNANLERYYEGWIMHEDNPKHLIVVAFTEVPEGIETGERISCQVTVDGYYFKLLGYMSDEKDERGKNVWRVAPLLVARKPVVIPDEREQYSWSGFVPLVAGLVGLITVAALILTVWFRRGDRRTRQRVRDSLLTNPFENAPPPVVEPGTAWTSLDDDSANARPS